jgi:hypothetical protein
MTDKFDIGDVCIPKRREDCGTFLGCLESYCIRITGINSGNAFSYDILNAKFEKIDSCTGCFNDTNVELLSKKIQLKNAKYMVSWDEKNRDPQGFFMLEIEAKEFIGRLLLRQDVIVESILLVELGEKYSVRKPIDFELVKI